MNVWISCQIRACNTKFWEVYEPPSKESTTRYRYGGVPIANNSFVFLKLMEKQICVRKRKGTENERKRKGRGKEKERMKEEERKRKKLSICVLMPFLEQVDRYIMVSLT